MMILVLLSLVLGVSVSETKNLPNDNNGSVSPSPHRLETGTDVSCPRGKLTLRPCYMRVCVLPNICEVTSLLIQVSLGFFLFLKN